MPFNSTKNGFQNEYEFINKINNKKVNQLDYYMQLFIEDLFDNANSNSKVICYKNTKLQKFDIFIKIDNEIRRVSVKKGIKNSVHTEPISDFIHFLIENKMPRKMIIDFLKYHYADGTTNGSGEKRISIFEYKQTHQNEIDSINKFINQEKILKRAIDRFIIYGRNSSKGIDDLIYGVPNDFLWIKKDDIYNLLIRNKDIYSTSIHFSSLTYQPLDRCINHNPKYEKCRFISQLKWYNISDDIIENMNYKVHKITN